MRSQPIIFTLVSLGVCVFSRISEKKCVEYKSAVVEDASSSVDKCADKFVEYQSASPKEFPHMALIGFESDSGEVEWKCTGTLISDEYVLTVAHCANTRNYGHPKYVRLGELNFSSDDDSEPEDYNVSTIIPHPEYRAASFYNDIALLKLNRKVKLSPYKRPACLPTAIENAGSKAISTEWETLPTKSSPTYLRKLTMEQLTANECNATYADHVSRRLKQGIMSDTQFCAKYGSNFRIDPFAKGISGAPLQIYHPDQHCMFIVIGVGSFGSGLTELPDVFTRVFPYVDWIESVVWDNNS